MMHSTNQRCNAFQSVIGVFLHAANAPETVCDLLARMGVSIATSTINNAVSSLSKEAETGIRKHGRNFLTLYAYDNLDIDLKHSVPTVEKPQDTLVHLTTGTMMPLYHDVTQDDLNCSDELWRKCKQNIDVQPQNISHISFDKLLNLYPDEPDSTGLFRHKRFNAWKYLHDLINFGPEYFQKFKKKLGEPEVIRQIPVVKTSQIPLRGIDISPSTPGQNAEALETFFRQAGIGDPNDNQHARSPNNLVILVSGDLLTIQHLRSLQESRAEEATSWRRMQFVVPVMGLFHLKMACADAMWRIFIHNCLKSTKADTNNLMAHVSQIRPKETRKIETKPGFRRMHEVIQHVGIVSRLDVWRIAAANQQGTDSEKTLDAFAKSEPTWDDLNEMARKIVVQNGSPSNLSRMRTMDAEHRDEQLENMILREEYFLLYEEISYALNHGDIGRVETCFMPWIYIFAGCGKHKYAAEMRRYLEDIHFFYPEKLR